jgi:Single-strand binding protein family
MINEVILVGRISQPVATGYSPRGSLCVSTSIMLAEPMSDADRLWRTFVPVIAYNKLAESFLKFNEGAIALIKGKLSFTSSPGVPAGLHVLARVIQPLALPSDVPTKAVADGEGHPDSLSEL